MKRLLLSCLVMSSMFVGAAGGQEVGSKSEAGAEPASEDAIRLGTNSIDLFADVMLASDIGGSTDGVYDDANAALLSAIANDTRAILADKVAIADAKMSNGMLLNDGEKFVYAKAGKATGESFSGHATADSLDTLAAKGSMPFFRGIVNNPETEPTYNAFSGRQRGQRRATSYTVAIPDGGLGGRSRYLLFVRAAGRHVPAGKSLAIGVLTGLATGGAYSTMPRSGGSVNVALIDKQSSRVLWAMQRPLKDFNQIQIVAIRLVTALSRTLSSDGTVTPGNAPASPAATGANAAPEYRSLKEAKLALKSGAIDRAGYESIAKALESRYRGVLAGLKMQQQSGAISDAAFEILSVKSELEYTGVSHG